MTGVDDWFRWIPFSCLNLVDQPQPVSSSINYIAILHSYSCINSCSYVHVACMHLYLSCITFYVSGSEWTLLITRSRLLFYFVFRTRSICFRTTYRFWGCRYFVTPRISMFCIKAIELIIR